MPKYGGWILYNNLIVNKYCQLKSYDLVCSVITHLCYTIISFTNVTLGIIYG